MSATDEVVLVDPNDEAIGQMDKIAAHRYPLYRHRASSVWLFSREGGALQPKKVRVLLQQRSRQKIVGGQWWGNTICGNVFPGETYLECAHRRLRMELGIAESQVKMMPAYKFEYKAFANETYGEHEVDQVFVGEFLGSDLDLQPNPDEVQDVAWVVWEEFWAAFLAWRAAHPEYPTAEDSLHMSNEELKKTTPVELVFGGMSKKCVPWTVMMLLDERFRATLSESTSFSLFSSQ